MAWDDYEAFCHVAKHGGFSAAARATGRRKSSLSAAVKRLEESLDVRLLDRNTRSLHLTEAGDALYNLTRPLFAQLDSARDEAMAFSRHMSGTLRIAAPYEFTAHHLGAVACHAMREHPRLHIQIDMEYEQISPVDERYDIVFTMTDHDLPMSGIVARRVLSLDQGLFASPAFVSEHGTPEHPNDLSGLPTIATSTETEWLFQEDGRVPRHVPLTAPRLRSFNANVRRQAAIAGLGITRVTATYCAEAVKTGKLVRILPDYRCAPQRVYALFSSRRLMPAKIRMFLDMLDEIHL